jgi:hypothetical protein
MIHALCLGVQAMNHVIPQFLPATSRDNLLDPARWRYMSCDYGDSCTW